MWRVWRKLLNTPGSCPPSDVSTCMASLPPSGRPASRLALRMLSSATDCVASSSASEHRYVEMGHLAQSLEPRPVTTRRCSHPCRWIASDASFWKAGWCERSVTPSTMGVMSAMSRHAHACSCMQCVAASVFVGFASRSSTPSSTGCSICRGSDECPFSPPVVRTGDRISASHSASDNVLSPKGIACTRYPHVLSTSSAAPPGVGGEVWRVIQTGEGSVRGMKPLRLSS
mmetsp:Transcript_17600/g.39468  ORF Transcript_17600/g.39468 Transcript_17600/m.39468 type:complete len:229 (+) Transcript_17600:2362-3048(+)